MGLFSKKKKPEEDILPPLPEIPENEMLPDLPPLPGEENLAAPAQEQPMMVPQRPRAFQRPQPVPMPQMPQYAERPRPAFAQMPQMPSVPELSQQQISGPATVFVRIDKYKDVMDTIGTMESKLQELRATLNAISAIKNKESEIIDGWNAMLMQTKSKIDEVSSKLQRPQE